MRELSGHTGVVRTHKPNSIFVKRSEPLQHMNVESGPTPNLYFEADETSPLSLSLMAQHLGHGYHGQDQICPVSPGVTLILSPSDSPSGDEDVMEFFQAAAYIGPQKWKSSPKPPPIVGLPRSPRVSSPKTTGRPQPNGTTSHVLPGARISREESPILLTLDTKLSQRPSKLPILGSMVYQQEQVDGRSPVAVKIVDVRKVATGKNSGSQERTKLDPVSIHMQAPAPSNIAERLLLPEPLALKKSQDNLSFERSYLEQTNVNSRNKGAGPAPTRLPTSNAHNMSQSHIYHRIEESPPILQSVPTLVYADIENDTPSMSEFTDFDDMSDSEETALERGELRIRSDSDPVLDEYHRFLKPLPKVPVPDVVSLPPELKAPKSREAAIAGLSRDLSSIFRQDLASRSAALSPSSPPTSRFSPTPPLRQSTPKLSLFPNTLSSAGTRSASPPTLAAIIHTDQLQGASFSPNKGKMTVVQGWLKGVKKDNSGKDKRAIFGRKDKTTTYEEMWI